MNVVSFTDFEANQKVSKKCPKTWNCLIEFELFLVPYSCFNSFDTSYIGEEPPVDLKAALTSSKREDKDEDKENSQQRKDPKKSGDRSSRSRSDSR